MQIHSLGGDTQQFQQKLIHVNQINLLVKGSIN